MPYERGCESSGCLVCSVTSFYCSVKLISSNHIFPAAAQLPAAQAPRENETNTPSVFDGTVNLISETAQSVLGLSGSLAAMGDPSDALVTDH